MNRVFRLALCLAACSSVLLADDGPFDFEFEQLAADVWTGVRPDGPRTPVMGNTMFVVGGEGVVVFDGGGSPRMSDQIIDKIRELTELPVTHVVISHWHGDHSFGAFRFAEEFPGVRYVAHRFTREMMLSPRMNYIDERAFERQRLPELREMVETGLDPGGRPMREDRLNTFRRTVADGELISAELGDSRLTPPDIVFDTSYTIRSGDRSIELLHLGRGNTEGDIVMWLPEEKIVAVGDLVVLPSPYAFNMPPRAWADTLRQVNQLGYAILVPGHGPTQRDSEYVDLLIETAEAIAGQRDRLLAEGREGSAVADALDFSSFEHRFTNGDEYVRNFYDGWFERPLRAAALKEVSGERMVPLAPPEAIPFDSTQWELQGTGTDLVDHLGRQALRIQGGRAVLRKREFGNVAIDFDVAVGSDRTFAGLMFRMVDDGDYEDFYIRPHQSGNPDANQYTPVFNGLAGWQLYHGPRFSAPVEYSVDQWMHVQLVIAGDRADVYIDSEEPVLRIRGLETGVSRGRVGLHAFHTAPAHFSNFRVRPLPEAFTLPAPGPRPAPPPDSIIHSWNVSDTFDGARLAGLAELGSALRERRWTPQEADRRGLVNLARVQGIGPGLDTVFVASQVSSDDGRPRVLTFGASDEARVYLNGRLLYRGSNRYQSRDYRYLGSIGWFDSIVLPLEEGENELWIAVTESFGGWGVQARLDDLDG